ncbi:putative bifunctional diguanylate cyclase/phosphodiesterase [Paractinoplanes durhamensis]|uniref:putative bifunctional diguanylate cyclase/phosphodiesterase n=1 Tax=Paractinoplanes durhamensis TaxID=113563 RepID=UPI00363A08A5
MGSLWSRLPGGRLLRASLVVPVVALVLVIVNAISPVLPWLVLWLPALAAAALLALNFRRTYRADHLPPATRRFWRHMYVVSILVGLGAAAQAADAAITLHTPDSQISIGQVVFDGAAVIIIIYAMLRLPFGKQSRSELFRVFLDAGTLMLGCAVFMWHYSTRHSIHAADSRVIVISLAITTLALLAVFAAGKLVMTGTSSYLDRSAMRMIGIAVAVGAVGPILRPLLEPFNPHLFSDMVTLPALFFFGAWAAEKQRAADYGSRRGVRESRRRSFSVLPYVAVAAVDALLLSVALPNGAEDRRVIVVSAVALTALVVIRQITAFIDNGRLLRRLDHGATHDALTQLPNRALFHERLDKALTAPGEHPVAVALIDLDDFKEVNDTLGHEVGDLLLIAVAERLNGCIRAEDTVARLGGDEFVVVLDDADPQAADLAAQRMIEALRRPVRADGHELPIRASIGIADGHSGDDASLLLRQADIAMYRAKGITGTAAVHFTPGADHTDLGLELRNAITDGQLYLLYQPIVALPDRRVLGAEALVRWQHPTHGTMPPQAFIPIAERTGLIVALSQWVLRAALSELSTWTDASLVLNINISQRDLREPDFADQVAAALDEYGIAPHRLTLEAPAVGSAGSGPSVAALRELGVRVALDDFGTGDSSLTMLAAVPVDELKLDSSFTQAGADQVPVAASVLNLANSLGLTAVAEGVETFDQASRLADLGYASAQGFYFAHPSRPRNSASF